MRSNIPPSALRPIFYNGTMYRSRLEAHYAVLWNWLSRRYDNEVRVAYESFDASGGTSSFYGALGRAYGHREIAHWERYDIDHYMPTFRIDYGGRIFFQEVRPLVPSPIYLKKLRLAAFPLSLLGYPLVLSIGGPGSPDPPVFQMHPYIGLDFGCFQLPIEYLLGPDCVVRRSVREAVEFSRNYSLGPPVF